MHSLRTRNSLLLTFLLLLPLPAFARDGDVSGTVTDQTGTALPGVTVEAASPALADGPRSARTDAEGSFVIGGLPAGEYSVSFSLSGFDILNREGVSVSSVDGANLDVRLQIESLIQEVTVVGSKLGTGRQEFGVSVAHLG
ncbi:MAG: carboxypeptidase-like regulatory domain-containing protein, partial [Acidobacteria bacterium]|nr:carboxypeptidase-like regulatory domain-containing protein [Acidobacteriota bacterium]